MTPQDMSRTLIAFVLVSAQVCCADPLPVEPPHGQPPSWDQIRSVPMAGDLRVFWDVGAAGRSIFSLTIC